MGLLPVGILNLVMFIYHCLFTLVLKSPNREWPMKYTFTFTKTHHMACVIGSRKSFSQCRSQCLSCFHSFQASQERMKGKGVHFTYRPYSQGNPSPAIFRLVSSPSTGGNCFLVHCVDLIYTRIIWRIKILLLSHLSCTFDKHSL